MTKLRSYVVAAACLMGIVAALAIIGSVPAGAQVAKASLVLVTNAAADWKAPVPVTGSVQAQQSAAWDVTVVNVPKVAVSGPVTLANGSTVGINPSSNTVQVGNLATSPVMVRNVDQESNPFQTSVAAIILPEGQQDTSTTIFTVPAGQRLVIEHVTAEIAVPVGQRVALHTVVSDNSMSDYLVAQPQATFQGFFVVFDELFVNHQTRMYVGPGLQLVLVAARNNTGGSGVVNFSASGHFVTLPFPQ